MGISCGAQQTGTGASEAGAPPDSPAVGGRDAAGPTGGYFDPTLAAGELSPAPTRQGLQYSGAVALLSTAPSLTPTQPVTGMDGPPSAWVELSAAILPKVMVLYAGQGADYPTTPEARARLAHDSALTFPTLLAECQPLYPGIVLWQAGDAPLSDAQVTTNYRLLEDCAYQQYLAKPYWIPQLVADVDICRQELGPGWRMLTENDVLALGADAPHIQEVLDGVVSSGASHPGSFYFSLSVWVLRSDGSVAGANLLPDAEPRFFDLANPLASYDPRNHYEGGLTLRCLRVGPPVP